MNGLTPARLMYLAYLANMLGWYLTIRFYQDMMNPENW